jgi:hypothetical protein
MNPQEVQQYVDRYKLTGLGGHIPHELSESAGHLITKLAKLRKLPFSRSSDWVFEAAMNTPASSRKYRARFLDI